MMMVVVGSGAGRGIGQYNYCRRVVYQTAIHRSFIRSIVSVCLCL